MKRKIWKAAAAAGLFAVLTLNSKVKLIRW